MLHREIAGRDNVRDGATLIVLLHGRGSNESDLLGLAPRLPTDAVVVAPRAPFAAAPWGYGPGWAWYRYLGEDRPEPDSFSEGQRALDSFLSDLPAELGITPGRIVLGGFSQGGTMSLGYALRHPGAITHIVNFSGFLPNHPEVRATPETVAGSRFFWGHGRQDPSIPFELALRGRTALRDAGADLEERDYDIGHWIAPEELAELVSWIGATPQP